MMLAKPHLSMMVPFKFNASKVVKQVIFHIIPWRRVVYHSTYDLFIFLGKRTGLIWIHRTSWPGVSISSKRQKSISSLTYTHTPPWADSFLSFLTKARPWRFTIFSDRRSLSHISVMQIMSFWCCFCCWKTCYKYSFIQGTCYMTFDKIKPLLRALLSWFRLGFWLRWLAWSWPRVQKLWFKFS